MLLLFLTTTALPLLPLLSTAVKKKSAKRKVSHGHYECQGGRGERADRRERMSYAISSLSRSLSFCEFLCSFCHAAPFVFIISINEQSRRPAGHTAAAGVGVVNKKSRQHTSQRSSFLIKILLLKYCGHLAHLQPSIRPSAYPPALIPASSLPKPHSPRHASPRQSHNLPLLCPFLCKLIFLFLLFLPGQCWTGAVSEPL